MRSTDNYKLTKDQWQKLFSKHTTKGEYDNIVEQIDQRFNYIMHIFCRNIEWYDYDNGDDKAEIDGWFDPDEYGDCDSIIFDGDYSPKGESNEIPISWLWEDFEEEYLKEVAQEKIDKQNQKLTAKLKRENLKLKKQQIREKLKKFLPKEEYKYIKL